MKKRFNETMIHATRLVFYNAKFVFLHWGANAAAALILSASLYYLLANSLSHSVLNEQLSMSLDYIWYIQFRELFKTNLDQLPYTIYSVVGIYALVQTFFLAGLVAVFHNPKKNHFVDFFYGGVKYWFRFTKVTIVSLFFFGLAFVVNDYLGEFIKWIFQRTEFIYADAILRSLRYLILLVNIALVTLVSDYTKIHLAITDELKLWRGVYFTLKFLKNNFAIIFGVFILVSVIGALGVVIYNFAGTFIPKAPFYYLILVFILQQMLIIFRLFIRMFFCASEVYLYEDLSAEVVSQH